MTDQKNGTTAIAPRPDGGTLTRSEAGSLIVNPDQLFKKIVEWQNQGYHVIGPAVRVAAFAQSFGVNAAVVVIDTHVDDKGIGPEVYHSELFHKSHERSLGKIALRKISLAAGVDWITSECGRTSDPAIQHYWEYRAVGTFRAYDGMIQRLPPGTAEVDLRDGSPQLRGMKEGQIHQARRFGLRLAESKATNAAIRELGLKSKYTVDELKKPFVVLRISYIPDMSDPEVKRMVTQHALAGSAALYAGRQPAAALPPGDDFVPLERPVSPASPAVPVTTTPTKEAPQAPAAAATDPLNDIPELELAKPPALPKPAYRLTDAAKFSENHQTVYAFKSDQTGEEWLKTTDTAVARVAADAKKAGTLLDITLERKPTGLYILELQPIQEGLRF